MTEGDVAAGIDLEEPLMVVGDTRGDLTGIWGDGGIFPPKCFVSFI